jgi:hypothetical protein
MKKPLTIHTRITLQIIKIVKKLKEMRVLSLTGTLDLMDLATRPNKVDLDPANLNLLPPSRITTLMQKPPQQDEVRGLLHFQAVREQP